MPSDEMWTETIRQVRTDDSFYYEAQSGARLRGQRGGGRVSAA